MRQDTLRCRLSLCAGACLHLRDRGVERNGQTHRDRTVRLGARQKVTLGSISGMETVSPFPEVLYPMLFGNLAAGMPPLPGCRAKVEESIHADDV